jgi:hypothetical protein
VAWLTTVVCDPEQATPFRAGVLAPMKRGLKREVLCWVRLSVAGSPEGAYITPSARWPEGVFALKSLLAPGPP